MERSNDQPFPLPANTDPFNYAPSNEQAAWFAIVYTAACIDGQFSEEEREAFCQLLSAKQLYQGHEIVDCFQELLKVKDQLAPKEIIRAAARLVSPEQAATLFCLATETLLPKGYLTHPEEELLDYIGQELALDRATTGKIKEVLLIKNKGNWNIQ
jgi:hypothetical protein